METKMGPKTNIQDSKVNSISKEGDILIWDRQGIGRDVDYGVEVLIRNE